MIPATEKLKLATVGIAGLGGLGSNVAVMLTRAGIGGLIIADFDSVEPSNLNRQHYFIDQLGKEKVATTIENLKRINPNLKIQGHQKKLNTENISQIFADADIIAECFDKAGEKQMIVETVLSKMKKTIIVSVSGLAGYGKSNTITTKRVSSRLILVGDSQSSIDSGLMLCSARVGIAACHQANAIIEFILDEM